MFTRFSSTEYHRVDDPVIQYISTHQYKAQTRVIKCLAEEWHKAKEYFVLNPNQIHMKGAN